MSIYSQSNKPINIINKNPISSHPSIDGDKFSSSWLSKNFSSDRTAYSGSILSSDNTNFKNQTTTSDLYANTLPSITYTLLDQLLDNLLYGYDIICMPLNGKQKKEIDPSTLGVVGNIYDYDENLSLEPGELEINSFVPKNTAYTIFSDAEQFATFIYYKDVVPGGSAYVTTYEQFLIDKKEIALNLADKIINSSDFAEIDGYLNKLKAATEKLKFLDLLPKFYNVGSDVNLIKNTYCKFNAETKELIDEQCGLAENHEFDFMSGAKNPDFFNGKGMQVNIEQYKLSKWPVATNRFARRPDCSKCDKWVVYCYDPKYSVDIPIYLEPYSHYHTKQLNKTDEGILGVKVFDTKEEAIAEYDKQLEVLENNYIVFRYFDENPDEPSGPLYECIPIHPLCCNDDKNWKKLFPEKKYKRFESMEECLDSVKWIVVCTDGIVSLDQESVLNEQDMVNLRAKYDNMENTSYEIFNGNDKDAAEEYKENFHDEYTVYHFNMGECLPIHEICVDALGIEKTYPTIEACIEDHPPEPPPFEPSTSSSQDGFI